MNRITQVIDFNQGKPLYMDLNWIAVFERALSQETKDKFDHGEVGKIDDKILADILKQTIMEAKSEDEIEKILWDKLHDWNLVVGLKVKYGIK